MQIGLNLALSLALVLGGSLAGCSTIKNAFNGSDQKPQASHSKQHHEAKNKSEHAKVKPVPSHNKSTTSHDGHQTDASKTTSTPENASVAESSGHKLILGKLNITVLYDHQPAAGAIISVVSKEGASNNGSSLNRASDSGDCSIVLAEGDYEISVSFNKYEKKQDVHVQKGEPTTVRIMLP